MLDWANGFFSEDGNRVVYSDRSKGDIAAVGQVYLVFQSTALSLDRSLMNYRVTMECENGKAIMKVAGIRYDIMYLTSVNRRNILPKNGSQTNMP